MEERHHPKAHRPSPRWKEPLVEEFPASNEQRRQNGSQTAAGGIGGTIPPSRRGVNGTSPAPSTTANGTGNGGFGNWTERERRGGGREDDFMDHGFDAAEPPPLALGEEAEEPFFFSEDFYQAFPHLRPSSSTGGGGRRWFSSASGPSRRRTGSSLLTEDPEFSSHLDRFDRNWRNDPFWRDLYPRWAEPIFKDGIDVKTSIVNDSNRFAVDIDTYQFRPEELQVKTLDDTLVIEGRHEDVRDRDNYTKMYFVRKYQLPSDVEPQSISSHVDSRGHLTVEARKLYPAIEGRERSIPIESPSGRRLFGGSRSSSYSPRDRYYDSGRGSANDYYRAESRQQQDGGGGVGGGGGGTGGGFLSPNPPKSNGYRTEFEQRQTDANGMRHEARREEFREEVRRTGSAANVLPPPSPVPVYRTGSRLSAAAANGGEESHFRRTASQSRNEFRQYSSNGGTEHLLRPADELGGRTSSSLFGRSVPIQRA